MKDFFVYVKLIRCHPLFDSSFYSKSYNVPKILTPFHYLLVGYKKGCNPGKLFNNNAYIKDYPDVKNAGLPPLLHYILFGEKERRKIRDINCNSSDKVGLIGRLFDPLWYVSNYKYQIILKDNQTPLEHYLETGYRLGFLPFEFFDLKKFNADFVTDNEPVSYIEKNHIHLYPYILKAFFFTNNVSTISEYLYNELNVYYLNKRKNEIYNNVDCLNLIFFPSGNSQFHERNEAIEIYNKIIDSNKTVFPTVLPERNSNLNYKNIFVFKYDYIRRFLLKKNKVNYIFNGETNDLSCFVDYLKFNVDDSFYTVLCRNLIIVNPSAESKRYCNIIYKKFFNSIKYIQMEYKGTNYENNPYFNFFDEEWYSSYYKDYIDIHSFSPKLHYLSVGWTLGFKPFEFFDIDKFYEDNPNCNVEPLHYWFNSPARSNFYFSKKSIPLLNFSECQKSALQWLYISQQVLYFKELCTSANQCNRYLLLIVSPEDAISGGIMSFYGIYKLSKELEYLHHRKVIAVTLHKYSTHSGFTMFDNDMPVIRYQAVQQIISKNVEDCPECYVVDLIEHLSNDLYDPINIAKRKYLNILNQKIEIMPEPRVINVAKNYFDLVTQTAAHYKYASKKDRDYYGIPTHLLIPPIYKNFVIRSYEEKENIFAYSYDESPIKEEVLNMIKDKFPYLDFVEIKNISFDDYLDLISRAKWCMTFGEGLDGYFSEPYDSGTISFAIWNEDYFTDMYAKIPTIIHETEAYQIANKVIAMMKKIDNKANYESTVADVKRIHDKEYATERTSKDQLFDFFNGNYDYP